MLHIKTTDNNCAKSLSVLIDKPQENDDFMFSHYAELSRIANIPLSELCTKNKNLLVFPDNAGKLTAQSATRRFLRCREVLTIYQKSKSKPET